MRYQQKLIIIFVSIISLPLVGLFLSINNAPSPEENRKLAPRPDLALIADFTQYSKQFESWFNDHFGFRNSFVKGYHKLQKKMGKSASDKVLIGKNDWLFYSHDGALKDYQFKDKFSQEELLDWRQSLTEKQDWLASKNIPYLFVIAPNKGSIYGEHLPDSLTRYGKESRLNQLLFFLKPNTKLQILNLYSTLKSAKETHQAYYKTDTHWNYWGASQATSAILKKLGINHQPWEMADFKSSQTSGGDLANLLGLKETLNEEILIPQVKSVCKQTIPYLETPLLSTKKSKKPVSTICKDSKPHALIFHDSFGVGLKPILAQHFGTVSYLWTRPSIQLLQQLVNELKPDIVIEQRVERKLRESAWGKIRKK
jgi:alginate O-acetyltransferase complex protein AlgJ